MRKDEEGRIYIEIIANINLKKDNFYVFSDGRILKKIDKTKLFKTKFKISEFPVYAMNDCKKHEKTEVQFEGIVKIK